jgi:DNA-binding MarR family transcriptional regulator
MTATNTIRDAPPGWLEFLRGHSALTRRLDAQMRAAHDLSLHEYEVLLQLFLAEEGRLRRVDLANRLLISQGGVTRLLAGLERRGLVCRAPCREDGRVVYAELTESGKELAARARGDHLAEVDRLFSDRFDAAELEQLAALLSRLDSAS